MSRSARLPEEPLGWKFDRGLFSESGPCATPLARSSWPHAEAPAALRPDGPVWLAEGGGCWDTRAENKARSQGEAGRGGHRAGRACPAVTPHEEEPLEGQARAAGCHRRPRPTHCPVDCRQVEKGSEKPKGRGLS